jgi:hypothetical protein
MRSSVRIQRLGGAEGWWSAFLFIMFPSIHLPRDCTVLPFCLPLHLFLLLSLNAFSCFVTHRRLSSNSDFDTSHLS